MSNVLGSIFVELKANVAEYVSGMGSAAYASKQAGRDIRESFEGLSGALGTILGPFGSIGEHIAETFSKVGQFSGSAATELGKFGGALGIIGATGGVAVGALAAIEAGAVGLAVHTAESIAQLHVLSQQTQVSTEVLSGLGYVAKQSGVDQETLAKGLEKLNKSVFAAATAAPGTINAFTRLGVSVRDAGGNIRATDQIFTDLAQRFAELPDGPAKGALAMQLFGKAGASLIPVLDQGRAGIAQFLAEAQGFGLIISGSTAEAAHAFEQNINRLKAAGEGAAISLTTALLPSLQLVTDTIVDGVKDQDSSLHKIIDTIKTVTQYFLSFGGLVVAMWKSVTDAVERSVDEIGIQATHIKEIAAAGFAKTPTAFFDALGAANKKADDALLANDNKYRAQTTLAWGNYFNFLEKAFSDSTDKATHPEKKSSGKVDTQKDGNDKLTTSIDNTIAKLREQADGELKLAAATDKSVAQQRLQVAANEADAIVAKLTAEANTKVGAQREAGLALIQREIQVISALTAEKLVAADLVALNNSLRKETALYQEQIDSLQALGVAYGQGGAAIAAAEIEQKLSKDKQAVADATEEYDLLSKKVGVTAEKLAEARAAIDNANAALGIHRTELTNIQGINISNAIEKSTAAWRAELPAIEAVNAAYLGTIEQQRKAAVQLKVAQYEAANPGASATNIADQTALLDEQSKKAHEAKIAQQAASFDLEATYRNQMADLEEVGALLKKNGDSTLTVDAAVYDLQNRLIQQWDAAALKVGNLTDKTRAFLNELTLQGQNLGESIFAEFTKGVQGFEDQLTKLVTTGKANFTQLFQSFEQGIAKASIQKLVSSAAGSLNQSLFGGAIPGGKPDGSTSTLALYVKPVDDSGKAVTGLFSKTGGIPPGDGGDGSSSSGLSSGIENLFSTVTSKISSIFSGIGSMFSSIFSSIASAMGGIGGFLGKILGSFGGGLAGGGDVSPGKFYVVGEQHPEFFAPRTRGSIIPQLNSAKGDTQVMMQLHIHGVTDVDSFKQSQQQIYAGLHAATAAAFQRVRG